MLVTKQLPVAIDFHSIFSHTVNYYSFQLLNDKNIDSQSDCKEYAFIPQRSVFLGKKYWMCTGSVLLKICTCLKTCRFKIIYKKKSYAFFRIRHPFLSKYLLRMRKRRKSNLIWIFLCRTKVSEAVCKRDWHNMSSYLYFYVWKFQTKFWTRCAITFILVPLMYYYSFY